MDLPDRVRSGLMPAVDHLRGVEGVAVIDLNKKDVIRHELVTRVIAAFKDIEENRPPANSSKQIGSSSRQWQSTNHQSPVADHHSPSPNSHQLILHIS